MLDCSTIRDKFDHLVIVVSTQVFLSKDTYFFSPLQLVINQSGVILAYTNNLPPNFISIHY